MWCGCWRPVRILVDCFAVRRRVFDHGHLPPESSGCKALNGPFLADMDRSALADIALPAAAA